MEKKIFAYLSSYVKEDLRYLQENGAEITQVFPHYGGGGIDGDFSFSTRYCILYKSEQEITVVREDYPF